MSDWQPIETAPKDGTPILVWLPYDARNGTCGRLSGDDVPIAVAAWAKYGDGWYGDIVEFESGWESTGSYTIDIQLSPTHWMPLPEPPK